MTSESPLHILQITRDKQLLEPARYPEATTRQERYLELLREKVPGSAMSIAVAGASRGEPFTTPRGVQIMPLCCSRVSSSLAVFNLSRRLHAEKKLSLITTQTLRAEAIGAALFGKLSGVPVLGQMHDDPFRIAGARGAAIRATMWIFARMFTRVRVVSPSQRENLSAFYPSDRVDVSPVPSFHTDEEAVVNLPEVTAKTVLYVGRFTPEKQLDLWIAIAAEVATAYPDARFMLVGEGAGRAAMEAQIQKLGLSPRVVIVPWGTAALLRHCYSNAALLLLTSDWEGFSRVIGEGFTHGLPCVAPRLPVFLDRVRDGVTGFTFAPGAVKDAAASIGKILSDSALRESMGRSCSTLAKEYAPELLARKWVGIMGRAVDRDLSWG